MSSNLSTAYQSGTQGPNYHFLTIGPDDDEFNRPTEQQPILDTQWKYNYRRFTPHQAGLLIQTLQNSGAGHNMTAQLSRSPDYLGKSYLMQYYPGITASVESGVDEVSYINARAAYAMKQLVVKMGSTPMFSIGGHTSMILMELYGDLVHYASMIGYCQTEAELKAQSRVDQKLMMPFYGLPFHTDAPRAFGIGGLSFQGMYIDVQSRPLPEMFVNYGVMNAANIHALPKQIGTNSCVTPTCIQFALATNCIWVGAAERDNLVHGYNQTLFRQAHIAARETIPVSNSMQRYAIDLNIRGCCPLIAVTVQSKKDILEGNHTKLCQDSGMDFIKEFMLYAGGIPREDGVHAEFYRTGKVIEVFGNSIDRHIYIISFETDARSPQPTGHQGMSNAEKLQLSALYYPHDEPLEVTVVAITYNGWYTDAGIGGMLYAPQGQGI